MKVLRFIRCVNTLLSYEGPVFYTLREHIALICFFTESTDK